MTRTARRTALLASLALALFAAGCGGDDEPEPAATTPAPTATTTPADETTEETTTAETTEAEDTTEAEEQPRARKPKRKRKRERDEGDEEEARTEVVLTGRGGKVTPRRVSVPPFLAIRVILRARDGDAYFVTLGGSGTGSGKKRSKLDLDGLRPGKSYDGRYFVNGRPSGQILIVADAEGGP